jgi:hypothetical protein
MALIDELIAKKKAQIEEINGKISALPSRGEAPNQGDFYEQGYQSAAQEMLKTDPQKAMELFGKAEDLSIKRTKSANDLLDAKKRFTPGTPEYIEFLQKSIGNKYNDLKYNVDLTAEQKTAVSSSIKAIEDEINKYPFGRIVTGKSGGTPEPTGSELSLSEFLAVNPAKLAADGSYSNLSDLTSKARSWGKENGVGNVLIAQLQDDLEKASEQSKANQEAGVSVTIKGQDIKKGQYDLLDKKFPGLREKSIPGAETARTFIENGDNGDLGARNQAVRVLSRMGSDEALTEQDFGRALGRSLPTGAWANFVKGVTGADIAMTDDEWQRVRKVLAQKINAVKAKRDKANKEFGNLLEEVSTPGAGTRTGSKPGAKKDPLGLGL